MASKSIELQIRPRGKPIRTLPESVTVDSSASTTELYETLAKRSKWDINRLRVTKGSDGSLVANAKDTKVSSLGLRDQSSIYVKDLGPQLSWRTVFLIEYIGPILIHPIVYALRPYIYSGAPARGSYLQSLCLVLIVGHFVKRELETIFVHRFSAATMPFNNVFKNSFHYWILSGANIAAWIYAPSAPTAAEPRLPLMYAGLILYGLGELLNLQTHLTLMNLRSPGSTERGIPQGWLFDLVTCPNYFTEIISWTGIWLVSNLSWSVLIFNVIAAGQMALWAKKKEARYRKEFGSKYHKKRSVMLPGII